MLNDKVIFDQYGRTLNKQYPFYVDSVIKKHFAFHVFASFAIISIIKKFIKPGDRNYLVDGTFKIAPRQFKQLLIISIEFKQIVCTLFAVTVLRDVNRQNFVRSSIPIYGIIFQTSVHLYKFFSNECERSFVCLHFSFLHADVRPCVRSRMTNE